MQQVNSLESIKHPKNNQTVYSKADQKIYQYRENKWECIQGEMSLKLTNYEANKQIISQLPAFTEEKLKELEGVISNFKAETQPCFYYMLLSKEASYYTVFVEDVDRANEFKTLGETVIELLTYDNATIRSYDVTGNGDIEIWADFQNETHCFHLFPYDAGVVFIGG